MNHGAYKSYNLALEQHMEGIAILSLGELYDLLAEIQKAQAAEEKRQRQLRNSLRESVEISAKLEHAEDQAVERIIEAAKKAQQSNLIESGMWEKHGATMLCLIRNATRNDAA